MDLENEINSLVSDCTPKSTPMKLTPSKLGLGR
jgi:hypothetical protein